MPPVPLPFKDYRPDDAVLNSGQMLEAFGAYPRLGGFAPVKGWTVISDNALAANPTGAIFAQNVAGESITYAGTTNRLYHCVHDASQDAGNFVHISKGAGTYTTGSVWRFAQFGDKVVAVNGIDAAQVITVSSASTAFADLGGLPPTADAVFACGDFLFLSLAGNAKVRWSAINDITGWTVGTGLCDEQEFPDGGVVYGVVGDKSGLVLQANAIRRFQFLAGDTSRIFEFDKIIGAPGCFEPEAWCSVGETVYYYSASGFIAISPNGIRQIGRGVDEFVAAHVGSTASTGDRVRAHRDPYSTRVVFAILSDYADKITLWYDYVLDRWGAVVNDASFQTHRWVDFSDNVDITALTAPGGMLAFRDTDGAAGDRRLAKQTGLNLQATFTLSDMELIPGRRSLVKGWRLQSDVVVSNVTPTDTVKDTFDVAGSAISGDENSTMGTLDIMASGRTHRIKNVIAASAVWTFANGLVADVKDAGAV